MILQINCKLYISLNTYDYFLNLINEQLILIYNIIRLFHITIHLSQINYVGKI